MRKLFCFSFLGRCAGGFRHSIPNYHIGSPKATHDDLFFSSFFFVVVFQERSRKTRHASWLSVCAELFSFLHRLYLWETYLACPMNTRYVYQSTRVCACIRVSEACKKWLSGLRAVRCRSEEWPQLPMMAFRVSPSICVLYETFLWETFNVVERNFYGGGGRSTGHILSAILRLSSERNLNSVSGTCVEGSFCAVRFGSYGSL